MKPRARVLMKPSDLQLIQQAGPYQADIWDFDGVIADTEPVQAESYAELLAKEGGSPPANFFTSQVGKSEDEIWRSLIVEYGLKRSVASLHQKRQELLLRSLKRRLAPNWFVLPLLGILSGHGVPSQLVSSGNSEVVEAMLEYWRLRPFFSSVASWNPGDSPATKERKLQEIRRRWPGKLLLIEDSMRYLRWAAAKDITTVGVSHSLNNIDPTIVDFVVELKIVPAEPPAVA